jgi:hypothetical protein
MGLLYLYFFPYSVVVWKIFYALRLPDYVSTETIYSTLLTSIASLHSDVFHALPRFSVVFFVSFLGNVFMYPFKSFHFN